MLHIEEITRNKAKFLSGAGDRPHYVPTILGGYYLLNMSFFKDPDGPYIFCRSGNNRLVQVGVSVTWKWDPEQIDLLWKFSGYANFKLAHLKNTYCSDEMIELCRERFQSRLIKKTDFISTGMNFGHNLKKGKAKTGECLQGITFLTRLRNKEEKANPKVLVVVQYRITEVTRRLVGDLALIKELSERVLEPCGLRPWRIRLIAAAAYTSNQTAFPFFALAFPQWKKVIRQSEGKKWLRVYKKNYWEALHGESQKEHKPFKYGPRICMAGGIKRMQKLNMKPLYIIGQYNGFPVVINNPQAGEPKDENEQE